MSTTHSPESAAIVPPDASPATSITDALWIRYRETGDPDARRQLLDGYLGLVHHVAREIGSRTPAVEIDELVSAGTLGLVRALESFDLSRGLAFSTYAMQRIRGAILDDLRARDWTPRSVRAKARQVGAAVATLEHQLGRAPEPAEIAEALHIDLATYWRWQAAVDAGVLVSLDQPASTGRTDEGPTLRDTLDDPDAPQPGAALAHGEQLNVLRTALAELPEKARLVLAMYYFEDLTLRQIAEVLHVTESRVSQIHTQSLRQLRGLLAERGVAV
jgi:RNA polymerase sigma factor for flagellar operon FliA